MSPDAKPGDDAAVGTSHYEHLRGRMLAGGAASGGFGLVVLIREGVAAWLAHAAASPVAITKIKDPITVSPIVSDDIHADVVSVLANMAMAISPQVHA